MTAQLPTRITIELQPGEAGSGWTARTAVVDTIAAPMETQTTAPRETVPMPAAYEPAPCTCLDDDGGCGVDHAND